MCSKGTIALIIEFRTTCKPMNIENKKNIIRKWEKYETKLGVKNLAISESKIWANKCSFYCDYPTLKIFTVYEYINLWYLDFIEKQKKLI
jgi:hypothetical protein